MDSNILATFQIESFQIRDYEIHIPEKRALPITLPYTGYIASIRYGQKSDNPDMRLAIITLSFKMAEIEDLNAEHSEDDMWVAICAQASFTCPRASCAESLFLQMLKRNGAGTMISIMRGSIFNTSAGLGAPGVMLPSINVLAIDNWEIEEVDPLI